MSLLDQLRKATFRGQSITIRGDDVTRSRKVATHEILDSDDPVHEDQGEAARTFSMEVVVGGNNYRADADQLENLFLQKGPGELVLPHQGAILIIVKSVSRRHDYDDIGFIQMTVQFEKTVDRTAVSSIPSSLSELSSVTDKSFAALASDFIKNYSSDMPDFIQADTLEKANSILSSLSGNLSNINTILPDILLNTGAAFPLANSVISLFKTLSGTLKPDRKTVIASGLLPDVKPSPLKTIDALISATQQQNTNFADNASVISQMRVRNAQSVEHLIKGAALTSAVQSLTYAQFESREQAIGFRHKISKALLVLTDDLGAACWDNSWQESLNMLSATVRDINERLGRLPKTENYEPKTSLPSIYLAHMFYGDDLNKVEAKAIDLATRNRTFHPGFMPSDKLEVLTDV